MGPENAATTSLTVVASDGVRLAVQSHGNPSGPTLLCVHGFPDDHSVWDGIVAELESTCHVVTFDVRGSGTSEAPRRIGAYRLDQLADDIRRIIDAVSPHRAVHLLGHDWGSVQAWHVATDARDGRIASLTSISGPCLDHMPFWLRSQFLAGPRGWREALRMWKTPLYMGLLQTPWLGILACRIGAVDAAIEWAQRFEVGHRPSRTTRDRARTNRAALNIYAANLLPRLLRPQRRHTDIPVQVLAPERDVFVSVGSQIHLDRWATDHRARTISGGHWAAAFAPAQVARHVREFIDEQQVAKEGQTL